MRADLHLHTNYSDGTLSPSEAVERHARAGLEAIAITDHDNIEGLPEAISAGEDSGVKVIPGVEISVRSGSADMHLLAYAFNPSDGRMRSFLDGIRFDRIDRVSRIIDIMKGLGVEIEMEDVMHEAGRGSIARPHIADALIRKGIVRDQDEAFDRFLGRYAPAYMPVAANDPAEAFEVVSRAGGVVAIAHPFTESIEDIVRIIDDYPLWGLEAIHSHHSPEVTRQFTELARHFGLRVTGGSDDHGPGSVSESEPGSIEIDDDVVAELLDRFTASAAA